MRKPSGFRKRKCDRMKLVRDRSFFEVKTLQELAREQGVGPVKDISVFAGGFPEDEDLDELLEEIYRLR